MKECMFGDPYLIELPSIRSYSNAYKKHNN